jgi:hypothetical protein
MTTPRQPARKALVDAVDVTRGAIEDLSSIFREHQAALNPEAREQILPLLKEIEEIVEELGCLVDDKDSYAEPEAKP